jgi:hypothetical protein
MLDLIHLPREHVGVIEETVKVVQQLVEPFRGSFRTVCIDRFYTSIDLIKDDVILTRIACFCFGVKLLQYTHYR